jgi:hypothetical protein
MLIDKFLPHFDVHARYQIDVHAPISEVYATARFLDVRNSEVVRWLYRLRGLPRDGLTLDGMLKWGFVLLADKPSQEVVFGLIGRFWTLFPLIQRVQGDAFIHFDKAGFAKAVGNMSFVDRGDGWVRVTTETRVHCPDDASRRCFRLYWLLVGPFSGIIRKEWLRSIKQRAEAMAPTR